MKNALGLFILAIIFVTPIAAEPAAGISAMQYYVGTWSCLGANTGQKPNKALLTYTLTDGVLHEWVNVPAQGKMTTSYEISIATTYDAKNARFVQTGLDSLSAWWVSYAKPWSGNTEQWADHANSTGKLGHASATRTDQNTFSFEAYPTLTSTAPNFRATCHRSM
jgi:hypothetical protein